jgi:hypothetical protein
VEEATLVVPGTGWVPPNPPPPRPWRGPAAPHNLDEYEIYDDEDEYDEYESDSEGKQPEPPRPRTESSPPSREHEHDHDHLDERPLPASVFIGLSLLPFLIPIVWLVASVIAKPPMLTFGTPIALAVATSILCLAVISTIDWTPATRVKGVLLLVVLSYLTGLGLYFVKREMVNRVQKAFGRGQVLLPDAPRGAGYSVRVPGHPVDDNGARPMRDVALTCRRVNLPGMPGYTFVYGSSPPPLNLVPQNAELGTDAWFQKAILDITKQARATREKEPQTLSYNGQFPGREFLLQLPDGQKTQRLVRIYVANGRVYYLAVDRVNLDPNDDDLVREFFESFELVK